MPELPEVETVRRGLDSHLVGRTITAVAVSHPRAVRRHLAGPDDLTARLAGQRVDGAWRRGKYLWLTFSDSPDALTVHLGMSGQLLVQPGSQAREKHAHIVAALDNKTELRFVDQRTFGGWMMTPLIEVDGSLVPDPVAHIARDPLDPHFNQTAVIDRMRARDTEVKRVLLDQKIISGIGNIYADEALWRAKLHGARSAARVSRTKLAELLGAVRAVMDEALAAGGTSFDALYVNVNGNSGYFSRSLNAYGREDEPCGRCGTTIRRTAFMNRSSFYCPRCQPPA